MKKLFLPVCLLGWACIASAQTNAPIAPQAPSAPVASGTEKKAEPTSSTTPDNTRYQNDPGLIARCQARLSAFNDKPCDIIFIGDSITEGWLSTGKSVWDEKYVPLNALNFGLSGDKTQNVLWRLNNMEMSNLKPKVAVIMIGTNNVANTPRDIGEGIRAVIANTQAAFGGVKIILVSIMPNERAREKMDQVNSIIKHFADEGTVSFLDLVPLMPPTTTTSPEGSPDTNWKGLSKDRLHPDLEGYKIWSAAMEPVLTKLLSGK